MRVIVTRPVPEPGESLLRAAGHDVTVGSGESLHTLVAGADGILAHLADPVDGPLMDAAGPQLRVVSNFAVGVDNVDFAAAAERDVKIGHTPDVLTNAVAEFAMGLVLAAV